MARWIKGEVEIEWQGQNKHIYRVFKQLPSGAEYLHGGIRLYQEINLR